MKKCDALKLEGVVLLSPVDLVKVWPLVWANTTAAYRTLKELKEEPAFKEMIAGWRVVTYQFAGAGMKPRLGYFNLAVVPNPRAWLETKLGPLADCFGAPPPEVAMRGFTNQEGQNGEHSDTGL